MALVPMELDNSEWVSKSMTVTSGIGTLNLYVNFNIKLAIISFTSGAAHADGNFTLPSDVTPLADAHGALRDSGSSTRGGYISVFADRQQGTLANEVSYTTGQVVFMIK